MEHIGPSIYLPVAAAMATAIGVLWRQVLLLQERFESLLREVLVAVASLEKVE